MALGFARALTAAALLALVVQTGIAGPAQARTDIANATVATQSQTAVAAAAADTTSPMVLENRKPGTSAWRIPAAGKEIGADTVSPIKGFMSATSVDTGEPIDLKVSVATAGNFEYGVYRMGWYQGLSGRLVTKGTAPGVKQAACQMNASTGMLTCPWNSTLTFDTTGWMSGIYLVVLTQGKYQNWAQFVVRDDAQQGAIVAMLPVNTFQAYNNYPEGAGKSLYEFNSTGVKTVAGTVRAVKVSFDRPYNWAGVSHKVWEPIWTAGYLESRGWPVKYVTNIDLDRDPSIATGQAGLLSLGHDEYWTGAMYTAAEQTRDAGVDLGFLGGNDVFWQVRYEAAAGGADRRVVVCYKINSLDPVTTLANKTILFRDIGRAEQRLIGVQFDLHGEMTPAADASWVVQSPTHWAYRGTGLTTGSRLPYLVGGEVDRFMSNYAAPTATSRNILARSPIVDVHGHAGTAEAWIYRAPSGADVFGAGTWRINQALGGIGKYDNIPIRTFMGNILARASEFQLSATFDRDGGADRYETAVLVSRRHFDTTGGTVVIATGSNFPDALTATPVTRGEGPVLLVATNTIPAVVKEELTRLAPSRVIIAGSASVVSDGVAAEIADLTGATVERRGGANRYQTAALLSAATFEPGVPVAYVATGLDFPDALAAGSAAATLGGPVLINQGDSLVPPTLAELQRLKPQRIVVVGSSAVVSDAVFTQLRSLAPEVVRLAGRDRYETSRAITRDLHGVSEAPTAYLATGLDFPDALAAAPAVASTGGVLVLVNSALGPGAAEEIVRNRVSEVIAIGSASVVSNAVMSQAKALFDSVADADARIAPAPPAETVDPPDDAVVAPAPPASSDGLTLESSDARKVDDPHDMVWFQPRYGG
ncbi:N,N-dimethylformamidase beta subunit family domain-containing protein [Agromyces sp. NPDC056523]|uniref:N,N-dimethylformamidase beta subunit family domain-containing protein n=1 Tax=Agromyces sp. NPDC056523 TaxID=3345850 RepID=UPI00366D154B